MIKKTLLACAILILAAAAAYSWAEGAQEGRTVIGNASKALGSENLRTLEFSGSGFDFTLGQAPNPSAPWPKFNDKTYTRVLNLEAPASRMTRIRTQAENPPHGGGQQPIVGEQNQNQIVAPGSTAAAALPDELMMLEPYSFLRSAASASDLSVKSRSMGGKKYTVLTFTALNKAPASGYVNDQNILERVETKIDNNVLGDIPFETTFGDYKDFAGLKFPTHIVQKQGGFPVLDLTITDVKPNAPVNFDQAKGKGGGASPAAAATAAPEKLGDGVWLISGGYGALAVDFKDYIVVVEGPQNDQRADTVISEAKRLIPNKPIKYVINTHSHFDHAGGLRAFVAEGATVVTQQINKPYYEKIWANPHTLAPDKLSKNPKKATFKTVADHLQMTDGNHVIELYHQLNYGHHDGMLLVYLPKEKVLLEADGYNPQVPMPTQTPATISPYNQNLLANIERLKLDVDRIVPVHLPADNRKVGLAELKLVVGRS